MGSGHEHAGQVGKWRSPTTRKNLLQKERERKRVNLSQIGLLQVLKKFIWGRAKAGVPIIEGVHYIPTNVAQRLARLDDSRTKVWNHLGVKLVGLHMFWVQKERQVSE